MIVDRLRTVWEQPFATDADPRSLLLEAADEIERLRSLPCPYVTGTVTRHCTLTPLTLTDAEREAVEIAVEYVGSAFAVERHAATLRGLLERMGGER